MEGSQDAPAPPTSPPNAEAADSAGKISPRKAGKAPKVTAGLQEMLDHASNQRKAEVLATRLAVLKQQEARVIDQTEVTRLRIASLGVRKHGQEQRIFQKAEALRKMHREDAFWSHAEKPQKVSDKALLAGAEQPEAATAEVEAAAQSLTQTPRLSAAQTGNQVSAARTPRTPREAASQLASAQRSRVGSMVVGGKSREQTPGLSTTLSTRLQTGDVVGMAHAQVVLQKCRKENLPKDTQIMPPSLSKYHPKDLVAKMSKKEAELQARLEEARKAQLAMDEILASRFKVFSAQQISHTKNIRDGVY